jgi:hypothetical protein
MMMGLNACRLRPAGTAVVACLGLVLAGCGGGSGSRLSTGAPPHPAPTSVTRSTTSASSAAVAATAGSGTVGPASTINAVPGTGGVTPPTNAGRPPTSTPATVAPPAPAGSGAYGYVTAGPTCPVERPDQPCPPRPVAAHIQVQDATGRDVGATDSDSQGRYQVVLAPGTYTLTAGTGTTYPHCQPAPVTVGVGSSTRADISCDTGIR